MSFRLILGSHNAKKLREMKLLLQGLSIDVVGLAEIDNPIEVDETGTTFQENAELKAKEQAIHLNEWVLAEDSGLSVQALNGQPGIYSARYSDPGANDDKNNDKLLDALKDTPEGQRLAWYTSHMALSNPSGEILINSEGKCFGQILTERRGTGGFGYDPLFELAEYHKTFGELGDSVKSVLSHRARANRLFVPQLINLIASKGLG